MDSQIHIHEQVKDTPIVRRPILDHIAQGKFTAQELLHMAHYAKSAQLYVDEAKRLERPIDVVNAGAGDMWDLQVLLGGMYVKKSTVLRTYTALDIIELVSPFGNKLSQEIDFTSVQVDFSKQPELCVGDESVDVVVATEIIEHVDFQAAEALIIDASYALRNGGVLFITTPNADNSSRSDKYHVDEWPLDKLTSFLESCSFVVEDVYGTYIDRNKFVKANKNHERIPQEVADLMIARFAPDFQRFILATPYPEYSNGVGVLARLKL